jgi:hypothetical protein
MICAGGRAHRRRSGTQAITPFTLTVAALMISGLDAE